MSANAIQDDTTAGSDAVALLVSYAAAAMAFTPNNDATMSYTFGADVFRYGPAAPVLFSKYANSQVAPFVSDINPGLTGILSPISINLLGDFLRDVFNPRLYKD